MKAEYDSQANAILIEILPRADGVPRGVEVHPRANVSLVESQPVDVELLYPDRGIEEPLAAAAGRFDLDFEALKAAARSAVEAPDRIVTLEVAVRR